MPDQPDLADTRATLRALAEALPPGTPIPVPREWILDLLGQPATSASAHDPDLTVDTLARRFGRSRSTVRTWLEHGRFPGAYRFQNREWRVPAAGVAAFEAAERERPPNAATRSAAVDVGAPRPVVDLSRWRRTGTG